MMRAVIVAGCVFAAGLTLAGCGTASRYEYYDYSGKTVDQKNNEKASRIGRNFNGIMSRTGRD